MSLLSHLEDPRSPIGQFFPAHFPHTAPVILQADRLTSRLPTIRPAHAGSDYPYRLIGMAIDYRLRYSFALTPKEQLVAWAGAWSIVADEQVLERYPSRRDDMPYQEAVVKEFFTGLEATLARIQPVGRTLTLAEEQELARYCFVLACFEVPFRSDRWKQGPLVVPAIRQSVAELLAMASPEVIDDLCRLSAAFLARYSSLLTRPAVLNPTFAGSGDVGGADADLIIPPCLIDLKATTYPPMKVQWLHQLLGYVLLDYEDAYEMEWVAIYLVRQAKLLSWKLTDLLPILTNGAEVSIPALRQELRAVIHQYRTLREAS